MAIGAVLGAAFEAFGPRFLRSAAKEGVESTISRRAAGALAQRVTNYTATQSGQRLVARAAGQRFATRLATHEGTQRAVRYGVKKDINQRVQGEGQHAPPTPTKVVNVSAGQSTVPQSVNDPSQMNIVNPNDPVVQNYQDQQRYARQQGGGRVRRQGGQGPTGWMGTGKGWWEQNEQITQKGAFAGDVSQLGDFSAARGPTRWAHSLGKGLARSSLARGVGFVEGVRSVSDEPAHDPVNSAGVPSRNAELTGPSSHKSVMYQQPTPGQSTPAPGRGSAGPTGPTPSSARPSGPRDDTIHDADVVEHNLTNVRSSGRGVGVEPHPTEGSYVGMDTQVGGAPQPRLSNFYSGNAEVGTGPAAIGPAGPTRRPAGANPEAMRRLRSSWPTI